MTSTSDAADQAKPTSSDGSFEIGSTFKRLRKQLTDLGVGTQTAYAEQAFSRNIGLISLDEQKRLAETTIAIPGMGGVGGAHLATATRVGFGGFHLADFDKFEAANVNRQFGARATTLGRPKLDVMLEEAELINPYVRLKAFPQGINIDSMDAFLENVDVVIDGLDFFAFDVRRAMFNRARERGIPVVTAGPLGFSAVLLVFAADRGMSFDDYFDVHDGLPEFEKSLRFAAGLAPRPTHWGYTDLKKVDLNNRAGPSSSIACGLCASVAVMEAVRLVLKRPGLRPVPHYAQFDPYVGQYRKGKLRWGNRNPVQRAKLAVLRQMLSRKK